MAQIFQPTTHELWIEGRQMTITLQKVGSTIQLTWTLPPTPVLYAGAVVLLSEKPFSAANFPVDGTRYVGSTNLAAPADKIGDAQVVAAFYSYFGDNVTQTTATITNIDPDAIYYASIHAASNVLQYYPIGVQSYPLESSRLEKNSDSYAGSIPSSATPPENPVNGQVYFDPVSNRVFVWSDDAQAWLEASSRTVNTGPRPPVGPLQVFFHTGEPSAADQLKVFNGGQWVPCTPTNTRVKLGNTWTPLGAVYQNIIYPASGAQGDVVYITKPAAQSAPESGEVRVFTLGQWFLITEDLIQFDVDGLGDWQNVKIGSPLYGPQTPPPPLIGDFFYDSGRRDLLVWTGSNWEKADTEHEGTPTTDKYRIGNDGSYDERLRLIKVLKGQLGWPGICLELSEEQFNIAIDNALETFRQRADNAYAHRYVLFSLKQGQQLYYLNDPRLKTDRIVNVLKIHRINLLGVSALSTEANVYAQAFFHQFFTGAMIDVTAIHLSHQLSETFERIFAGNLSFTWDEPSRQLYIHRRMRFEEERVVLEVTMERTEQELLLDRWCKQWLQAWAHAELKEMLGMIRSKYTSGLPGPTGGISLNGDQLLAEARSDFEELNRQLLDYEVGNGGVNFMNTAFMIG